MCDRDEEQVVQTNHSLAHWGHSRVRSHVTSSKASLSIAGGLGFPTAFVPRHRGHEKQILSSRGHCPRLELSIYPIDNTLAKDDKKDDKMTSERKKSVLRNI